MTRRIHRLKLTPEPHPTQLVFGLDGGLLAALGKRAKARKFVAGGAFDMRRRVAAETPTPFAPLPTPGEGREAA